MKHRNEGEQESVGDRFQFAEGEIAFVQLPVAEAFFDDLIYKRFDFLRRRFFYTARSAFYCIGKADNGAFLRLRFRSAVTKTFFVHLRNVVLAQSHDLATCERVFMLLQPALIKITDERCAVMLLNNVDDGLV